MTLHVDSSACIQRVVSIRMTPSLDDFWNAALVDADMEGADVVFYRINGAEMVGGDRAMSWPAGIEVGNDGQLQSLGAQAAHANGEHLAHPRVVVCTGHSLEVVAALIRHELEHVAQFRRSPQTFDLHARAVERLRKETVGKQEGGKLYNSIPMEFEANVAASHFVRKLFGRTRIDEIMTAEDRPLLQEYNDDILTARMRHFILIDAVLMAKGLADET